MPADALTQLVRWAVPVLIGGAVAGLARRAGSLSRSGAWTAALVGTVSLWAGWSWGLYLIVWFVLASLASRLGASRKRQLTEGVVAKGGARDAWQVLANGGVFALLAVSHVLVRVFAPMPYDALLRGSALAAAAALAAAGADTLATEVGVWRGGTPWSVRTGRPVPPGTSGAVSAAGTLALMVAALMFASLAVLTRLVYDTPPGAAIVIITVAGIGGAFVDTLVGAWYQQERWCAACEAPTEQMVHVCGTPTSVRRGWHWLTNDGVNVVCTLVGAGLAVSLAWRWKLL